MTVSTPQGISRLDQPKLYPFAQLEADEWDWAREALMYLYESNHLAKSGTIPSPPDDVTRLHPQVWLYALEFHIYNLEQMLSTEEVETHRGLAISRITLAKLRHVWWYLPAPTPYSLPGGPDFDEVFKLPIGPRSSRMLREQAHS